MAGYTAWQVNDMAASHRALERASGYSQHKQAALLAMRRIEAVNESQQRFPPVFEKANG